MNELRLISLLVFLSWPFTSGAQNLSAPATPLSAEENYQKARVLIEEQFDFMSALPYLHPAAEAGYVRAQVWLAQYLDYGEENAEAERLYGLAVAAGDAEAKMGLATMHISGDTLNPSLSEALRLVREAASDNYPPAVKALAAAYVMGGLGISEEERGSHEARSWIEKAAALDDIDALRHLEAAYRTGRFGFGVDPTKADEFKARIRRLTGVMEKEEAGRRRRR